MTIIFLIISIAYFIIISTFAILSFTKKNYFNTKNRDAISIIIPFKNEEKNIPFLIKSMLKTNTYKKDEIIWINDRSKDKSPQIVEQNKIGKVFLNNKNGKKEAINTALKISSNNYIITTDADAEVPKNWLNKMFEYAENKKNIMIIGPVCFKKIKNNFFNLFQRAEQICIQTISSGSAFLKMPTSCSGANLLYSKKTFFAINAYKQNIQISSGDDMFLLQKFKTNNFKIKYCNSPKSIVCVKPVYSLKSMINQRIRWGHKMKKIYDLKTHLINLIILTNNIIFTFCMFSIFVTPYNECCLIILFLKLIADGLVLIKGCVFFKDYQPLKWFLILFFIFPIYIIVVEILSLIIKNKKWK